jgi:excisionase family DNA binding protein
MCAEMTNQLEPGYYTPEKLAAPLQVPKRRIEKWSIQRKLPIVKVGYLNRFPRLEIR